MLNKQKIIKRSVFFIIILTLLVNLVYFGYTKYCQEFSIYNSEITSTLNNKKKNQEIKIEEYREACLKLKPGSLIPFSDILGYWSGLMIVISIATMAIVIVSDVLFIRKKMFSRKEKLILLGVILLSFIILFNTWLIDLHYYYWSWGCSQFF